MATITLRSVKGTPLTNNEVDANFTNLNNDKVETADAVSTNTANKVVKRDASGNFSAGTITATLSGNASTATSATTATTATTATNIAGGSAGTIPYQTASGTTAQLSAGSVGQVLQSNGAAAPTWVSLTSLDAGTVDGKSFGTFTAAGGILYATSTTAAAAIGAGTSGQVLTSNGASAPTWQTLAATSGSGLFNTSISSNIGYGITDSLAIAYTAPATSGKTYVIHSVHVTNVGSSSADVSGQLSGTTYSNISFANTIPVPVGSSVELLKKPKVMQPNDVLRLQASLTGTLYATITIEAVDSTKLFGKGVDIVLDATYFDLHTATANSVLESILLANDDGVNDLKARVVWTDGDDNIQGYYAYDLVVPADATVEVLEQPKYLPNGHKIRVYSNIADRLEAIIAGKTV